MVTRSGREEIVIISQHLSVLTYRSSWLAYPTFRQKTELGCPSLGCSSLYNTAILDLSDFFFFNSCGLLVSWLRTPLCPHKAWLCAGPVHSGCPQMPLLCSGSSRQ